MMKTRLLATMLMIAATGVAQAGGQAGSIGVGAEYQLSGVGGASVNFDAGQFHVGGLLGFFDPPGASNTIFELGGQFYYHLHSTAMSDFGLGGSLGIASIPVAGVMGNTRNTDVFLEPGFQIRLFLASNVALSFTGGIVIGVIDASSVAITAQGAGTNLSDFGGGAVAITGGAGIHYYFF